MADYADKLRDLKTQLWLMAGLGWRVRLDIDKVGDFVCARILPLGEGIVPRDKEPAYTVRIKSTGQARIITPVGNDVVCQPARLMEKIAPLAVTYVERIQEQAANAARLKALVHEQRVALTSKHPHLMTIAKVFKVPLGTKYVVNGRELIGEKGVKVEANIDPRTNMLQIEMTLDLDRAEVLGMVVLSAIQEDLARRKQVAAIDPALNALDQVGT